MSTDRQSVEISVELVCLDFVASVGIYLDIVRYDRIRRSTAPHRTIRGVPPPTPMDHGHIYQMAMATDAATALTSESSNSGRLRPRI